MFYKLRRILLGKKQNPLHPEARENVALIALLAWIGLGADGLSSSCYGPEEAFLALGPHHNLGLYLALAMALTVFIISFSYNQVIELFPNGGGGYKVASQLVHPYVGLISGAALIIDYVLTIAISIASGVDALFSLLPSFFQGHKLLAETILVFILIYLNIRGMKESIKILMPIFIGFVVIHLFLIFYGLFTQVDQLPQIISSTTQETQHITSNYGAFFLILFLARAYALGGGTYTGLEAVSNNVNTLAEPRVKTGKWTMLYMAVSLSFTAAGIVLLYLFWHVQPVAGKTLNAVVFERILSHWSYGHFILIAALAFEAGLLFVGANTGFLGGPAVLANMAIDSWMPNRFRNLSNRLVTQNGIILFGLAALFILYWSKGHVDYLVVLYSIDVFLTFSISLFGLSKYWFMRRHSKPKWFVKLLFSILGCVLCCAILVITLTNKFFTGGWFAIAITLAVIAICFFVKSEYRKTKRFLDEIDKQLCPPVTEIVNSPGEMNKNAPTAVFFVGANRGAAIHSVLWAKRLFPEHFKNFVFARVGVIDVETFSRERLLEKLQRKVEDDLNYYINFAHMSGVPARCYRDYGTDPLEKLELIAERIINDFPNCVFFASRLIFARDNWLTRLLHNDTAMSIQRRLHLQGKQMVILPMLIAR